MMNSASADDENFTAMGATEGSIVSFPVFVGSEIIRVKNFRGHTCSPSLTINPVSKLPYNLASTAYNLGMAVASSIKSMGTAI